MKSQPKEKLMHLKFLLMIALLFLSCKDLPSKPSFPLEKFETSCKPIGLSQYGKENFYFGKKCLDKKEEFSCVKAIQEIREKGIETYFFGKTWDIGEYTMKYHVDRKGEIKIVEHGPDGSVDVWKKKGRFFKKGNLYYLATPKGVSSDEMDEFPIKRIDCKINDMNFENYGSFLYFTFSNNEIVQRGNSLIDNSPFYIYSESFIMAETTKPLPNPEPWHKISIILSE